MPPVLDIPPAPPLPPLPLVVVLVVAPPSEQPVISDVEYKAAATKTPIRAFHPLCHVIFPHPFAHLHEPKTSHSSSHEKLPKRKQIIRSITVHTQAVAPCLEHPPLR